MSTRNLRGDLGFTCSKVSAIKLRCKRPFKPSLLKHFICSHVASLV